MVPGKIESGALSEKKMSAFMDLATGRTHEHVSEAKKHLNVFCILVREESMNKNGRWLPIAVFFNCASVLGD